MPIRLPFLMALAGTLPAAGPASAYDAADGAAADDDASVDEVAVARAAGDQAVIAADAGLGGFAGDATTALHALVAYQDAALRVLADGRLRLRMVDRGRQQGTVRREDWDEPSDFAHVLRELSWRGPVELPSGPARLELRVGEQRDVTLGHGTIVREYTNALDPDHLRAGARVTLTDPVWDLDAVLDDYLGPRLVALRSAGRPLDDRLEIGGTLALDLRSPVAVVQELDGARALDRTRNLRTDAATLVIGGLDVGYRLGDRDAATLTPYADANAALGLGAGLHAGALARVPHDGGALTLRGEYRLSSSGYLPAWADTVYDVERLQFELASPGRAPRTKHQAARAGGFAGHGFLFEAGATLRGFEAAALAARRPGPEGATLGLRAGLPAGRRAQFGLRYLQRAVGQSDGPDGLLLAGNLRWRLDRAGYATFEYARLWQVRDDGVYRPIDVAMVGVGLSYDL